MNTKWFDESGNLDMKKLIKLTPEESVEAIREVIEEQRQEGTEELEEALTTWRDNADSFLKIIDEVIAEEKEKRNNQWKTKKL